VLFHHVEERLKRRIFGIGVSVCDNLVRIDMGKMGVDKMVEFPGRSRCYGPLQEANVDPIFPDRERKIAGVRELLVLPMVT